MAKEISIDLDTVLNNVKLLTTGLAKLPDGRARVVRPVRSTVSETVEYGKGLRKAVIELGQDVDALRDQLVATKAAIVATINDMEKAGQSVEGDVAALRRALDEFATEDAPAAGTPSAANVPIPPATKGTFQ